jgi:RNA polymerase sigma factor (sigma-70 family)
VNELLRDLAPQVLGVLVRRGGGFAAAEDAVQDALLEAVRHWPEAMPDDPKGWLVRVAGRKLIDARRSEASRRRREVRDFQQPAPGPAEQDDDTLLLLSRCCHPLLSPASAVALALRAVGGLTTAQIAQAFLVPEPTMAQRISRAKHTVSGERFERPGDARAVLRVLYLMFNEGSAPNAWKRDHDSQCRCAAHRRVRPQAEGGQLAWWRRSDPPGATMICAGWPLALPG